VTPLTVAAGTRDLQRSVRWELAYAAELDRRLRTGETAAIVVACALNLAEADRLAGRQARA
jgi:hypothetical protein